MPALDTLKEHWPLATLATGILLFAAAKLWIIAGYHHLIWDEAVYLTMAKFLVSGGAVGMWETLRPPLLPTLLAGLQLLADPVTLGLIIENAAAALGAVLLYDVLRKHARRSVAAGTALLLLFSGLWFSYSTLLLTGTLSAAMIIAACWLYEKDKHAWAGVIAALAFLTRFPAGLGLAALGAVYAWPALKDWWEHRRPVWDEHTKNALRFATPALLIVLAWLTTNWLAWHAETSTWWHAVFRPLIMGSTNVAVDIAWLYDASYGYYFVQLLKHLPITVFAVWGLAKLNGTKSLQPLALQGLLALAFFTWLPHNEWRFALLILPGLLALCALGLDALANRKFAGAATIALVLIGANLAGALAEDAAWMRDRPREPQGLEPFYTYLAEHPVRGPVIMTDPHIGRYAPNPVVPVYFDVQLLERSLREEHGAVAFVPSNFPCPPDDTACEETKRSIVDELTTSEKLVYHQTWRGNDYYIFSDAEYLPALSTDELRSAYGLGKQVVLSKHPRGELPVTFVLEDFPSLDDDGQRVWREDDYEAVLDVFADTPATAAVIPTHLRTATAVRPWTSAELRRFHIAQNGYDHTGLPSGQRIAEGRTIIKQELGTTPAAFIPPYYDADEALANALEKLGYDLYISTPGDPTSVSGTRLDQTNTLILNWEERELKTPEEVLSDVDRLDRYADYALMSVYYFMYNDSTVSLLNETVVRLDEEYAVMGARELARWLSTRSQSTLSTHGSRVVVDAPSGAEGLTLLVLESGNYTVESPVPLHVKSGASENITVCLSGTCEELAPDHFLNTSPIVLPDDDDE